MAKGDEKALKDMLLSKQIESGVESTVKFRMCSQNTIMFLGAEKGVYDPDKGVDNMPPWPPDRRAIRDIYLKELTPLKILRSAELQSAEKSGAIDRLVSQVHTMQTVEKLARIIRVQFQSGKLTGDQRVSGEKVLEVADGMFRRKF